MPAFPRGSRLASNDDKPVSPHAQTVTAAADPLVGTTLGHYRIVGRLGQGGMGVVYRAEDEKLRRPVALKVLPDTSGNEERRQRFLREARSAAAITHPNVAVVYQVDEADGRIYIAMELVEGENLRARLERGRFDPQTARDLAVQIAHGLAAAHDKGIVHRDLKPENVMIAPVGVVKLLDFGLAKVGVDRPASGKTEAALARTETVVTSDEGRVMGTPEYMSPEQALGEPLDVRSDVFSLGIVMYEMFAGTRPFGGTTTGAILVAIARDVAPPLREKVPEVDEATEAVVMRCLEKAPSGRYANAGELSAALSGWPSAKMTPESRPAVAVAHTADTRRRSRMLLRIGLVLVAFVLVGGALWRGACDDRVRRSYPHLRRPRALRWPSPTSRSRPRRTTKRAAPSSRRYAGCPRGACTRP
jgi:serine/threonine protein kinase